ncbi:hypothetical protein [Kribbella italica]|uniref:Uncharacterized protein n=1 Tax=Kribbella italica TaxID=1540520 RepID=A0A7W9MXX5_9ACTN|nr:hypothetical protein [Kribbella italica]MBB5839835.1 hypothetical protein [Kribbella italica]
MTKTFTTPRFQTVYDRVVEPLVLPGELRSGEAPDLTTVDQFVRGVAVIGRFVAAPGLLGVKVRPTGRPVRVIAHVRFDTMSLDWWEERVPPTDDQLRGVNAPRLLLVRSQGKTRGAILLIRHAADAGRPTTGVISFDLRPEELSEEGLFILEVASIDAGRPDWAPAVVKGPIGIMMDTVEFVEVDGTPKPGRVSTGTVPVDPDAETMTVRGGYFVANPDERDEPRRWIARATVVEPLVPGPTTKVEPVVEPIEVVAEPVVAKVKAPPSIQRRLKRKLRRAARWVVPVAAAPAAQRMGKRAAALERRLRRAASRRNPARSATPPPAPPPPPPPPPPPVVPAGPPPNPLADVMFDLVDQNLVHVELAGVEPGPVPEVRIRARADAEIEIVTDGPLEVPVLVRLSVDSSVLQSVPGADGGTVRWDLVVDPGN